MTNAHFASLAPYRDIESINWAREALAAAVPQEAVLRALAVKSRDNARTPMQWDDGPGAGFTSGTPWIDLNPNHTTINAAAAVADPDSVLHHYRRLIQLRHEVPVVVHGGFRLLAPDHEQVFAYVRDLDGARLLVVANLSGAEASVDLGTDGHLLDGEVLVSSGRPDGPGAGTRDAAGVGEPLVLAPWEARAVLS